MPLRELIAHIQHHRTEMNEIQDNNGRQVNEDGSESAAQSNALTNAINVGGIPITNTVSGTHTASTSTGHTGSFKEQFSIGQLGLTAGLNSQQFGTGFGIDRKPGEFALHLGALNFGLNNHAGDTQNSQTQTIASSSATGAGATSTSQTDAHSNSYNLGNAVSVQNTVSSSQAHSSSLTGTTSADAEATSATSQNAQASNPIQYQQQPINPQPDVTQQSAQQPFVEMKVIVPQPGYQQNPQPGYQQEGYPQPGSQTGYQQPNLQRPGYQPTGIE